MSPLNKVALGGGSTSVNGDQGTIGGVHVRDKLADRMHVQRSSKAFASLAVSKVDLPASSLFAKITTATPASKAYTSVQIGENAHIELNSDLVYCNHSCAPTVDFDMSRMEVRVAKDRDLRKGEPLTFFYPSSEWDMAQPFECTCGAEEGVCCGTIRGAKDMDEAVLRRYWLNDHIERLLAAKKAGAKAVNGATAENGVEAGVAAVANGV
jgi:hypothetical protein